MNITSSKCRHQHDDHFSTFFLDERRLVRSPFVSVAPRSPIHSFTKVQDYSLKHVAFSFLSFCFRLHYNWLGHSVTKCQKTRAFQFRSKANLRCIHCGRPTEEKLFTRKNKTKKRRLTALKSHNKSIKTNSCPEGEVHVRRTPLLAVRR